MIIREAQIETFRNVLRVNTEKEFVEHCRRFAPQLCKAGGDDGVLQTVRLGLERARSYSFRDKHHVQFYIEIMLVLGSEFDTDPQFPWAAEILQDLSCRPHVRALTLHRDLSLYLDRVMGPLNEFARKALLNFVGVPVPLPSPEEWSIGNLRNLLWQFFPQKSSDLSDEQLSQIAAAATNKAREFELASGEGLLAGLMLVFGHGATHDALYPWISNCLSTPPITSQDSRLQRLWAKLRIYAESAGKYLGQPR